MKLTILFNAPYWIALLEEERDGYLYAARYIFGAEPSNEEVYEFVRRDLITLQARMTVGVPIDEANNAKPKNPKRMQREIQRELAQSGINTKAQQAMRLQIEEGKQERRRSYKQVRAAETERKRQIAIAKAKKRHRGH